MGLLDGDLATTINSALDFLMRSVTLTQRSARPYDGATGTFSGVQTPTAITGRGFRQDFTARQMASGQIVANAKLMVMILQKSMLNPNGSAFTGRPALEDTVTIDNEKWTVVGPVSEDPAGATWLLQVG